MTDNEIAKIVNDLRDIAVEFGQTQQLRERIAQRIVPVLKRAQRWHQDSSTLGWIENPDRMGR